MKIKIYNVAGLMVATLQQKGEAGGYMAYGKTAGDAIENVLLRAMNSRVQL